MAPPNLSPLATPPHSRHPAQGRVAYQPVRVGLLPVLMGLIGFANLALAESAPYTQAQALVTEHQWAAANDTIAQGLSTHPKDARLRLLQGVVWAQMGQTDRAQAVFTALMDDHPELSEPYNNLGILLAQRGDADGARQLFEHALLADPGNSQARANLEHLTANGTPSQKPD